MLQASPQDVWAVASTMAGVNAELAPLIRMTHPHDMSTLNDIEGRAGPVAFDSWLLLFGLIPIDRHHLGLERVLDDPSAAEGLGFDEESRSWLQKRWRHERRIVSSTDGGCAVTDRITVVPRMAITRPLVRRIIPAIFRRRHRRLAARFGHLRA